MESIPEEAIRQCCKCGAAKFMAENDCLARTKGDKGGDPTLATCTHERCQQCRIITPKTAQRPKLAPKPSMGKGAKMTMLFSSKAATTTEVIPVAEAAMPKEALVANADPPNLKPTPSKKRGWNLFKKTVPIDEGFPVAQTSVAKVPVAETPMTEVPAVEIPTMLMTAAPETKADHPDLKAPPIENAAPVIITGWLGRTKSEEAPAAKAEPPNPEPTSEKKRGWNLWKKTEAIPTAKEEAMAEAITGSEPKRPIFYQDPENWPYMPYERPKVELPEGLHHAWECCACKTGKLHRVRPENEICELFLVSTGARCPHKRCKDCQKRVMRGVFYD